MVAADFVGAPQKIPLLKWIGYTRGGHCKRNTPFTLKILDMNTLNSRFNNLSNKIIY